MSGGGPWLVPHPAPASTPARNRRRRAWAIVTCITPFSRAPRQMAQSPCRLANAAALKTAQPGRANGAAGLLRFCCDGASALVGADIGGRTLRPHLPVHGVGEGIRQQCAVDRRAAAQHVVVL